MDTKKLKRLNFDSGFTLELRDKELFLFILENSEFDNDGVLIWYQEQGYVYETFLTQERRFELKEHHKEWAIKWPDYRHNGCLCERYTFKKAKELIERSDLKTLWIEKYNGDLEDALEFISFITE